MADRKSRVDLQWQKNDNLLTNVYPPKEVFCYFWPNKLGFFSWIYCLWKSESPGSDLKTSEIYSNQLCWGAWKINFIWGRTNTLSIFIKLMCNMKFGRNISKILMKNSCWSILSNIYYVGVYHQNSHDTTLCQLFLIFKASYIPLMYQEEEEGAWG